MYAIGMDDDPPPLVSAADWVQTPPAVQLAFLTLVDLVHDLSAQVQDLRARLNQTSRNSSQPPSSDPPSAPPAPPARLPRGRTRGAQKGHPDQQRPLLPPQQVDTIVPLRPTICPHCRTGLASDLPLSGPVWYCQIWEVPPIRPIVTEYQQQTVCCPTCQHAVTADLPPHVPPGVCGPRLTALIGLLHGGYHLSMRTTAELLADVCGIELSVGSIAAGCGRLSLALAPIDTTIQVAVQHQPQVWVDETSWREQQQRGWLWVAVSPVATCFRIAASRSQQALRQLIGTDYSGIVHSDRASMYHALPDGQRQLCWAHILRNLQGLVDHQHDESGWAHRILHQAGALFTAWHAYCSGLFDQIGLQQALIPVRLALRDLLELGATRPWPKLQAVCQDLLRHWDALGTFSRVEGLEPTNNTAERALRPAVVWRKSCYGTQSAVGSRFVERMLSVQATCAQQGRNLFAFLTEALRAAWAGQPAPAIFGTP
jgi:transposase